MTRNPLASLLILCLGVVLAACNEAGDDRVNLGQSFTLSGYAANGPLDGATVEVSDPSGKLLGSTKTDAGGRYSLPLDVAPPYRVTTSGGQYGGQAYAGSLTAQCDGPAVKGTVQCDLTPLSSVVVALLDRGYNLEEGEALLEQRYGPLDDPFTRELRTGQTVATDEFDLAAARTAINNGQNLDAWVTNVADWLENPLSLTGPPGTPKYSIALNAGIGGSAMPNPVTVLMNEQAVFSLVPDVGYHLVSASGCGGTVVGSTYNTAPINDVTAGNGDCVVTANFALNQYSVSYGAGPGGSLVGSASQTVAHGDSADPVSAVADTGYGFIQWSDGVGTATRTDSNVTGDISVTAQFGLNQYTLTYTPGTGGTITGASPQTVDHGSDGTMVTAVASTGYTFSHWSDGVMTASRTDASVTGDINVTALFTLNEYTLTYSAGSGGSISGTTPQTVNHGSNGSSVTAVADTGYRFVQWSDGVSTAMRTDAGVTGDISVSAQFALNEYILTYSAGTGGSISGTSPQTVSHGNDGSSVTAVADTGYTFTQWSDGVSTAARTDTGVTGDISVSAEFALNEYTLSYSAGTGGSISGTSPQTVSHGNSGSQVSAVPDSGYAFDQWSDGVTTADRTDSGVTADISVTAGFVPAVGTPDGVTANGGDAEVTVSWNPVSGADSYNLYYATDSGVTPANYNSLPGGTRVAGVSSAHTVTGLINGTAYYFIVTAVQSGVEGSASTMVSATPEEPPLTPWLTGLHQGRLQVDVRGPTTAIIDWPTASGETYNLYIAHDPATDLNNYAASGATLRTAVLPPLEMNSLPANQPVYLALEVNGVVTDWTAARGRVWGTLGQVKAQALDASGNRFIGGSFSHMVRITGAGAGFPVAGPVGSPDHELGFPEIKGQVRVAVSDGVGGWYIGGAFTHVGGQARASLARINARGQVTAWNPGVSYGAGNPVVSALAVADGVIYVGGRFTGAGGGAGVTSRSNLAAFDAAGQLTAWNPGANGQVETLAIGSGVIYAGGGFTAVGGGTGSLSRSRVAAFDTNGQVLAWNPGVAGPVYDIELAGGVLYAGGFFSAAGGGTGTTARSNLAAFDANGQLTSWNPGADMLVRALEVADGVIYAGGQFSAVGGGAGSTARAYLAAFDTSGQVTGWDPGVSNAVYDLKAVDGVIYAGGNFRRAGGGGRGNSARFHLAAFDVSGQLMDWSPDADGVVLTVAQSNAVMLAGGHFRATGMETRTRLAAFDVSGALLDWAPGADGEVRALEVAGGVIYAGGDFTAAGGGTATTPRSRLAAFDTNGQLTAWNPGVDNAVFALAVADGVVYTGGYFTSAGNDGVVGTPRSRLAAFNMSGQLTAWNPGADGGVNALEVAGGVIYAGGAFGFAGGGTGTTARNNLAAFDTSGLLTAWNPGAAGGVSTLAIDNGVIYAGGGFSRAGGGTGDTPRYRLAAFDLNGQLTAWNPGVNSTVEALEVANGVIYAGGTFYYAGVGNTWNFTRQNLAAFDASGAVTAWDPGVTGTVHDLASGDSRIFAAGGFVAVGAGAGFSYRANLAVFDNVGSVLEQ